MDEVRYAIQCCNRCYNLRKGSTKAARLAQFRPLPPVVVSSAGRPTDTSWLETAPTEQLRRTPHYVRASPSVEASPGPAREPAIHLQRSDAARGHCRLLQVRDAEAQHGPC